MIKNIFIISATLGLIFFWAQELQARFTPISIDNSGGPIVVELFTSQSCSSCPPADQIMGQLSEHPKFIPLSFHVTYWDHLHWKDTLGRSFADRRQRAYSRYKNMSRVYTPQMIINGQKEFVGSRKYEADRELGKALPVAQIQLEGKTEDITNISVPSIPTGDYRFWIAGVKETHTETIKRGENKGKEITYKNSVLSFDGGEWWDGTAKTLKLKLQSKPNIDYYVVYAQEQGFGEIVAAGKIIP